MSARLQPITEECTSPSWNSERRLVQPASVCAITGACSSDRALMRSDRKSGHSGFVAGRVRTRCWSHRSRQVSVLCRSSQSTTPMSMSTDERNAARRGKCTAQALETRVEKGQESVESDVIAVKECSKVKVRCASQPMWSSLR